MVVQHRLNIKSFRAFPAFVHLNPSTVFIVSIKYDSTIGQQTSKNFRYLMSTESFDKYSPCNSRQVRVCTCQLSLRNRLSAAVQSHNSYSATRVHRTNHHRSLWSRLDEFITVLPNYKTKTNRQFIQQR